MEHTILILREMDMNLLLTGISIFVLLIISAFFSGSETALTGASKAILRSMTDKGSNGAKKALQLREENERLIGSLLLGNNLINILAAALATNFLTQYYQEGGVWPCTCGDVWPYTAMCWRCVDHMAREVLRLPAR